MIDIAKVEMGRLPEPQLPATLKAGVMARVARLPVGSSVAPTRQPPRTAAAWTWSGWPAWMSAAAGVAIVIGTRMHAWIEAGTWPDVTSSRIGGLSLIVMPVGASATLLLALGLLLCLAGLFAPLSRRH